MKISKAIFLVECRKVLAAIRELADHQASFEKFDEAPVQQDIDEYVETGVSLENDVERAASEFFASLGVKHSDDVTNMMTAMFSLYIRSVVISDAHGAGSEPATDAYRKFDQIRDLLWDHINEE